jgi:hypothetical protein
METLQEIVTRQASTVDRAIKLDRGHLEHARNIKLVERYGSRLLGLLKIKRFYLQNYSDLLTKTGAKNDN